MRGQKEKILTFLLIGLLALSSCSAPGAESPTPAPEPTPTATESPAPTPTPAPEPTPTPTTEEPTELWGFPIDDTHDAFEVPTGGKLGTLLVTIEREEASPPTAGSAELSIWDISDLSEPIQTISIEGWVSRTYWNDMVDANFDGYVDFGINVARGATATAYWDYWLWNEEKGQFEEEPTLGGMKTYFDAEREIVCSRWSLWDYRVGGTSYSRWEDEELVAIRTISRSKYIYGSEERGIEYVLTIKDNIDGVLTEVFQMIDYYETILDEAEKWENLDYHGE